MYFKRLLAIASADTELILRKWKISLKKCEWGKSGQTSDFFRAGIPRFRPGIFLGV